MANCLRSLCLVAALCAMAVSAGRADSNSTAADEQPKVLVGPPPEFPAEMKQQQINGVVILVVSVNKLGFVEDCVVKKSSRSEFEQPAVDAVRTWTFRPARKNGHDVAGELTLPVKFAVES